MPSEAILSRSKSSTSTPSSASASMSWVMVFGYFTLLGSETRSRVTKTPVARLSLGLKAASAAAGSSSITVSWPSVFLSSSFFLVWYLSKL